MDAPACGRSAGKPIASAEARYDRRSAEEEQRQRRQRHDPRRRRRRVRAAPRGSAWSAGRDVQAGLRELIVGRGAQGQFRGLEVGSHIALRGRIGHRRGVYQHGDAHESELLADVETVLSAYRAQSLPVDHRAADSADRSTTFKSSLTTNPQLSVDVMREREYYAKQSERMSTCSILVAYFVGGIMAVGAIFGALNTMYSAVSARTLEIPRCARSALAPAPSCCRC